MNNITCVEITTATGRNRKQNQSESRSILTATPHWSIHKSTNETKTSILSVPLICFCNPRIVGYLLLKKAKRILWEFKRRNLYQNTVLYVTLQKSRVSALFSPNNENLQKEIRASFITLTALSLEQ